MTNLKKPHQITNKKENRLRQLIIPQQIKSKSTEQVAIGDPKFCQDIHQIWREWVIDPIPSRSKFKGSTTKAVLQGLASIDNLDRN